MHRPGIYCWCSPNIVDTGTMMAIEHRDVEESSIAGRLEYISYEWDSDSGSVRWLDLYPC